MCADTEDSAREVLLCSHKLDRAGGTAVEAEWAACWKLQAKKLCRRQLRSSSTLPCSAVQLTWGGGGGGEVQGTPHRKLRALKLWGGPLSTSPSRLPAKAPHLQHHTALFTAQLDTLQASLSRRRHC